MRKSLLSGQPRIRLRPGNPDTVTATRMSPIAVVTCPAQLVIFDARVALPLITGPLAARLIGHV
jgi:hypothetical protein